MYVPGPGYDFFTVGGDTVFFFSSFVQFARVVLLCTRNTTVQEIQLSEKYNCPRNTTVI